jgi:hypothetical protein
MILRDKFGWPVELIEGRPILNFFRRLLVTSVRRTWAMRNEGWPQAKTDPSVTAKP